MNEAQAKVLMLPAVCAAGLATGQVPANALRTIRELGGSAVNQAGEGIEQHRP
jgi:hypothetical protein